MRKSVFIPALMVAGIGQSALAGIFLNGNPITDFQIKNTGSDVFITTQGGSTPTDPTDPTDPTEPTQPTQPTEPTDPTEPTQPTDGTCGALPNGVEVIDSINWRSQGSQTFIELPKSGTKSSEFTTTSGTSYFGQVSVVSVTGTSGYKRRVWISECPGGPAVNQSTCSGLGTSSTNLYWTQGSNSSWQCNLERNKRYYLNYTNENCPLSACSVYRNLYNNKKP